MDQELSVDEKRAQGILRELLRSGEITVEQMAKEFGVSTSTIRRDLRDLERQGLLRRMHGEPIRPLADSELVDEPPPLDVDDIPPP